MASEELKAPPLPYVPLSVLEKIMYRLPVKSLVRFKTVCKSWEATISNPRFCHTFSIQKPKTQSLFLVRRAITYCGSLIYFTYSLIKLENREFQIVSDLDLDFVTLYARPVCSCNGLVLFQGSYYNNNSLGLWNPSFVENAAIVPENPIYVNNVFRRCGLYYDPRTNDYKVVIICPENYSVFSCKSRSWGRERPYSEEHQELFLTAQAVFCEGCFYFWRMGEIICFDVRQEEWKTLQELKYHHETDGDQVSLRVLSGRVCLYRLNRDETVLQLCVMEKSSQNHACVWWRELIKMERPEPGLIFARHGCLSYGPICLTNEENVVIRVKSSRLIIYNKRDKRFEKETCSLTSSSPLFHSELVLCWESLAFPLQPTNFLF